MVGQTDGQTDNSDFVGSSVGRGPIKWCKRLSRWKKTRTENNQHYNETKINMAKGVKKLFND